MSDPGPSGGDARDLDPVADDYVRLALAVGRHDSRFIDAYFGPPAWRKEAARGAPRPLAELLADGRDLLARARAARPSMRRDALEKQIVAVEAFLRRLSGEKLSLAEEARLQFDIDVPATRIEEFEAQRDRLERLLPGRGDLAERVNDFSDRFLVREGRIKRVAAACREILRERTRAMRPLPRGERLRVTLTRAKPWPAYHWYHGGFRSRIEINADLRHRVGSLLRILAHEGYPGHHVYASLIEQRWVRGRGWREFTVLPLFSPFTVVSEGLAVVAESIGMTSAERVAVTRDTLAPLAGLQGLDFETYEAVREACRPTLRVMAAAGRRLLEGQAGEDQIASLLIRYGLMNEDYARQSIAFARAYGGYIFAYPVGEALILKRIGNGPDRVERFFRLFDDPVTPSGLVRLSGARTV